MITILLENFAKHPNKYPNIFAKGITVLHLLTLAANNIALICTAPSAPGEWGQSTMFCSARPTSSRTSTKRTWKSSTEMSFRSCYRCSLLQIPVFPQKKLREATHERKLMEAFWVFFFKILKEERWKIDEIGYNCYNHSSPVLVPSLARALAHSKVLHCQGLSFALAAVLVIKCDAWYGNGYGDQSVL